MSKPKYIEAKEFWNRLISVSENDWVEFDTIDKVLSEMPTINNEIINDAHNEGYDVGYWAGRRDYEPKWIPVTERLPEQEGQYLVSGKWANEDGEVWICKFVRRYNWGWCNKADRPVVQAWMRLPEPYKGGEEE